MLMVVTGVAGFIGSHLADRLLAEGHRVIGIDNLSRGTRQNITAALTHSAFCFLEADLSDLAAAEKDVLPVIAAAGRAVDTVWHMAANSDIAGGIADPAIDLRDTFATTFNTLWLMRQMTGVRVALASTSAVYGVHPGKLTETVGPLLPISNYGAMKLASEAVISAAVESHLQQACIFRLPNVVGSRGTHGVIYDLLVKLARSPEEVEVLGDGRQRKPYLHVSELIDAMMFIWRNQGQEKRVIFNIGPDDEGIEVAEIAQEVVTASGTGARIRFTGGDRGWIGDVPRFRYSIEKLAHAGWRPRSSSAAAVRKAIRELAVERGFR
jgi:UDP-glucose 4-epimerase